MDSKFARVFDRRRVDCDDRNVIGMLSAMHEKCKELYLDSALQVLEVTALFCFLDALSSFTWIMVCFDFFWVIFSMPYKTTKL